MSAARHHAPLVFLVALGLYLLTSAPGLTVEDSAELATGARFLTMVHAPGYPLYLILGRLAFALDAISGAYPGRGLVLLSAFAAAAAVTILHATLRRLHGPGAALVGAASLAVLQGFWEAGIIVEVYALQSALFAALLHVLVSLAQAPSGRGLRLLGLLLGLMLAHHVGVIILLPFLLGYLAWTCRPFPTRDLPAAAGYLALGLLLYAALPLLSARPGMPISWWPPITSLDQLVHVAGGAGFRKLLFAVPAREVAANLVAYPIRLAGWLNILSLVLAAAGTIRLARHDRPLLVLLGGILAMTIVHSANYAVLDPESFLLPAAVPLGLLAGSGFRTVEAWRGDRPAHAGPVALTILVLGIAGRLATGHLFAASVQTLPLDIARAVLTAHDRAATVGQESSAGEFDILWSDWHLYPTLRYAQIAEGLGRNVRVELDSTAETPGPSYKPGRTWAMRPSREMGAVHPLRMEDLHWRVLEPRSPMDASPRDRGETHAGSHGTAIAAVLPGGIHLVGVETTAGARFGEAIPVLLYFRVEAAAATERETGATRPPPPFASGSLVLVRNGHPILRTPWSFPGWRPTAEAAAPDRVHPEPVQSIVPTTFARASTGDRYALALEFDPPGTSDGRRRLDLGPISVTRN